MDDATSAIYLIGQSSDFVGKMKKWGIGVKYYDNMNIKASNLKPNFSQSK